MTVFGHTPESVSKCGRIQKKFHAALLRGTFFVFTCCKQAFRNLFIFIHKKRRIITIICNIINIELHNMRATISLDSLRETIRSTSIDNQRWLLDKLQNNIDNMCNVVAEDRTEYISKQEILAGIDAGLKELKLKREGKIKPVSAEETEIDLLYIYDKAERASISRKEIEELLIRNDMKQL